MITLTDDLKFEYLLDSAVLIDMGGRKALVDGFPADDTSFDRLSPELEEAIMGGQGDFEGLRNLFFTHCHRDHYSRKKLAAYLERNPETFLVVPENEEIAFRRFEEAGAEFFVPTGAKGELKQGPVSSEMEFEFMKTEHLTYDCPEHFAYNFLRGDTNVIVTGDMDLVKLKMLEGFSRREHSFIFLGIFVLWHKRWCDIIDKMGFEKVLLYHMPSEENDAYGYREKALAQWPEIGQSRPNWEILNL